MQPGTSVWQLLSVMTRRNSCKRSTASHNRGGAPLLRANGKRKCAGMRQRGASQENSNVARWPENSKSGFLYCNIGLKISVMSMLRFLTLWLTASAPLDIIQSVETQRKYFTWWCWGEIFSSLPGSNNNDSCRIKACSLYSALKKYLPSSWFFFVQICNT